MTDWRERMEQFKNQRPERVERVVDPLLSALFKDLEIEKALREINQQVWQGVGEYDDKSELGKGSLTAQYESGHYEGKLIKNERGGFWCTTLLTPEVDIKNTSLIVDIQISYADKLLRVDVEDSDVNFPLGIFEQQFVVLDRPNVRDNEGFDILKSRHNGYYADSLGVDYPIVILGDPKIVSFSPPVYHSKRIVFMARNDRNGLQKGKKFLEIALLVNCLEREKEGRMPFKLKEEGEKNARAMYEHTREWYDSPHYSGYSGEVGGGTGIGSGGY